MRGSGIRRSFRIQQEERWIMLALALASSLWILFHIEGNPSTGKTRSTLATIEAVADQGTFAIDNVTFQTNDRVKIGDHFVSPKPPVLPVIGAGVYRLYRELTGVSFANNPSHIVFMLTAILSWLPNILLLLLFAHFIFHELPSPVARLLAFAALNLSYLGTLYALELQNHTPAAFLAFAAFVLVQRIRREKRSPAHRLPLTGFLSGLLVAIDPPMGAFAAALFLSLVPIDPRKSFLLFLPAAALPVAAHSLLSFLTTGTWISAEFYPELFLYEGSYWLDPGWFDLHDDPKWLYFLHMTFGHHGFFSMAPILLLGVLELFHQVQKRGRHLATSIVVGTSLTIVSLFYLFTRSQYGGIAVGYRWLIPFMPLLMLFAGHWIERNPTMKRAVVAVLFLAIGFLQIFSNPAPYTISFWETLFR